MDISEEEAVQYLGPNASEGKSGMLQEKSPRCGFDASGAPGKGSFGESGFSLFELEQNHYYCSIYGDMEWSVWEELLETSDSGKNCL